MLNTIRNAVRRWRGHNVQETPVPMTGYDNIAIGSQQAPTEGFDNVVIGMSAALSTNTEHCGPVPEAEAQERFQRIMSLASPNLSNEERERIWEACVSGGNLALGARALGYQVQQS